MAGINLTLPPKEDPKIQSLDYLLILSSRSYGLSMRTNIQVGDRLCCKNGWMSAPPGAICKVIYFKGTSVKFNMLVLWETPERNFSPDPSSALVAEDLEHFEFIPN